MKKYLLILNTLKYLKWTQVYFRIYRKLFKSKVTDQFSASLPVPNDRFKYVSLYGEKISTNLRATFLNHSKQLNLPYDWNNESHSKLWVYNLHYFEDLLAVNAELKHKFHIDLLDKWTIHNPIGTGNAWEPYPISLRLSNMLKAWQGGLPLEQRHFVSLYTQASFLSNNLEKHLLGNHYFVNLKALLFAGVIFDNHRWLNIAIKGLEKEVPEQILYDGAHFELSPMYHAMILVDTLDMYNLCQAYSGFAHKTLVELFKDKIPKMLRFMSLMAHNDGKVSFFNDSVDGIAPSRQCIEAYATQLGFGVHRFDAARVQAIALDASGYMIASNNGTKLIFDAANVGPDYIPGHAHADTLSFELSVGGDRVIVNTGTSQYGLNDKRLQERKTAAHNTVEVDGFDSSQVWGGFRVAKRARVLERSAKCFDQLATLSASHDGYRSIYGGPVHMRTLHLASNSLVVIDELKGKFQAATARFYFHPELRVQLKGSRLFVTSSNFEMTADLSELAPRLVASTWHPGFGLSQPNWCLVYNIKNKSQLIKFIWTEK